MSTGTALNWLPNCVHGLVHKTNQKVRGSEAGANSIQIKKSRSLPLQSPTLFDETPLQVVKELRLGQGIRDIKRRSHGPFATNISNYYKEAKVKKKKNIRWGKSTRVYEYGRVSIPSWTFEGFTTYGISKVCRLRHASGRAKTTKERERELGRVSSLVQRQTACVCTLFNDTIRNHPPQRSRK